MKLTKIKHPIYPKLLKIKGTQAYAHPDVTFGKNVIIPKDSTALFLGGYFEGGTFQGGNFYRGTFWGGTFDGGYFEGGTFYRGTYYGGTFYGGTFWGGTYYGGTYYGGIFEGGTFHRGLFEGGAFRGGIFRGGAFWRGTWREGHLPLQIQGSKDFLNSPDGKVIAIGCYEKTPEEWLKEYEEVGEKHDYTTKQMEEYKRHIDSFIKEMQCQKTRKA